MESPKNIYWQFISMNYDSGGQPVAIVIAQEYKDILEQAVLSFEFHWQQCFDCMPELDIFDVPTAAQIPWQSQKLAATGVYSAIIALGMIDTGTIYHYEHLVSQINNGIMRISIKYDVPILSYVRCPRQANAAQLHTEFFQNEYMLIGKEAVNACKMLYENMSQLEE